MQMLLLILFLVLTTDLSGVLVVTARIKKIQRRTVLLY